MNRDVPNLYSESQRASPNLNVILPAAFKMSGSLSLLFHSKHFTKHHRVNTRGYLFPQGLLARAACVSCCVVISLIAQCKISHTSPRAVSIPISIES